MSHAAGWVGDAGNWFRRRRTTSHDTDMDLSLPFKRVS